MEVRVSKNARAIAARRGLKEAWSKCASRWTRIGYWGDYVHPNDTGYQGMANSIDLSVFTRALGADPKYC